jgi:hypothetical protein
MRPAVDRYLIRVELQTEKQFGFPEARKKVIMAQLQESWPQVAIIAHFGSRMTQTEVVTTLDAPGDATVILDAVMAAFQSVGEPVTFSSLLIHVLTEAHVAKSLAASAHDS